MRKFLGSAGFYAGCVVCLSLFTAACGNEEREDVILDRWTASPHADSLAWSFRHWTTEAGSDQGECATCHEADRGLHEGLLEDGQTFEGLDCAECHDGREVPSECARCHSTDGYRYYLGLDRAAAGPIDGFAPDGNVLGCAACHNELTGRRDRVSLLSGAELEGLGPEAICVDCHQARHATTGLDIAVSHLADDEVDSALRFIDPHNGAAGSTQYGDQAKGGYQYDDKHYEGPYTHILLVESCIDCHDPHSTSIKGKECTACHPGASTEEGRHAIRTGGTDYDGDRDVQDGLAEEIATLRDRLLRAMQIYAARTKGLERIMYEDERPYYFDTKGNPYSTWTPRLLRAAYNHRYTAAPGGFAHGGKYLVQLLHDSMTDLGLDTSIMIRP